MQLASWTLDPPLPHAATSTATTMSRSGGGLDTRRKDAKAEHDLAVSALIPDDIPPGGSHAGSWFRRPHCGRRPRISLHRIAGTRSTLDGHRFTRLNDARCDLLRFTLLARVFIDRPARLEARHVDRPARAEASRRDNRPQPNASFVPGHLGFQLAALRRSGRFFRRRRRIGAGKRDRTQRQSESYAQLHFALPPPRSRCSEAYRIPVERRTKRSEGAVGFN